MTRSRLAPGVAVVTVPGRGTAVRTADGEFLRVTTGEVPERILLEHLADADAPGTHAVPGLEALLGAFAAAGHTVADRTGRTDRTDRADREGEGATRPRPAHPDTVWLLGDDVLTRPLAGHLREAGAAPRTAVPEEVTALVRAGAAPGAAGSAGERPAAVVWCLDRPVPTGLWDDADRLPALGVAWLRCHREGWQAWVEPPAFDGGDVTSAHVRLRRLAATPAHHELAAYWAGERVTGDDRPTGPTPAALVTALLAADLAAGATVGTGTDATHTVPAAPDRLPPRRRLRRVDLRDLTVTAHPVLPVPEVAPLPRPRGAA
ncbi:hypothetical protein F0L17_21040 [Streptomyces sp. TRM43335]|uniref:Uncharacterized protein n=1 Tax=Streptomyces taklimakanensis TaxID=2569853 RepID=A0A6G2BI33_9ACTN|nr:hypothetical protein [Streptomyces taklimakanensis]